jgi:hypothetical protein
MPKPTPESKESATQRVQRFLSGGKRLEPKVEHLPPPNAEVNTRSTIATSLPESANGGQIDRRVLYRLLICIMLSTKGKYLKIINCLKVVIYFVMFYTHDVSNRPITGNIADNE